MLDEMPGGDPVSSLYTLGTGLKKHVFSNEPFNDRVVSFSSEFDTPNMFAGAWHIIYHLETTSRAHIARGYYGLSAARCPPRPHLARRESQRLLGLRAV